MYQCQVSGTSLEMLAETMRALLLRRPEDKAWLVLHIASLETLRLFVLSMKHDCELEIEMKRFRVDNDRYGRSEPVIPKLGRRNLQCSSMLPECGSHRTCSTYNIC